MQGLDGQLGGSTRHDCVAIVLDSIARRNAGDAFVHPLLTLLSLEPEFGFCYVCTPPKEIPDLPSQSLRHENEPV